MREISAFGHDEQAKLPVFDKVGALPENPPAMPLITFEGAEGCGKSTQVERLAARLAAECVVVSTFREPGGTAIGEAIRHLLQHSAENRAMAAETELLLFEASRSQLVREEIQPRLQRGDVVICDRFFDSTTVYQGAARALDLSIVQQLNALAAADCIPELTFLLDIDRATALARLAQRHVRDRMEDEPEEFHERVIAAYRELAEREPARIFIVDGRMSPDAVSAEIWEIVSARFCRRRGNQQSEISNRKSA